MMPGFAWFRSAAQAVGHAPAPVCDKPFPGTCFHCDSPLPAAVADWVEFEGSRRALCCGSCLAAAEMLIANGFAAYYRERDV